MAVLTNGVGVVSALLRQDTLLTLYVFGKAFASVLCVRSIRLSDGVLGASRSTCAVVICSDVLTMALLLPHMFFLVRFMFDLLLILLAIETRGHLVCVRNNY